MNSKIFLTAALLSGLGLAACDSNDTARVTPAPEAGVMSGATTDNNTANNTANAPAGVENSAGSGSAEMAGIKNENAAHEKEMKQRKVSPDHARGTTSGTTTSEASHDENVSSGTSEPIDDQASYNTEEEVWPSDDVDTSSGATSSAQPEVSYSQTPHRGGIAPEDRNLRYGTFGNGTGIGLEDTTSKYLTDNFTLADPLVNKQAVLSTGALSAPTDEQDPLLDIKSGTSFDADEYDIER